MLRIIDRSKNRTMTVDGTVFTVKPMSVRDKMILASRIAELETNSSDSPIQRCDSLIDILAEQIVSIEGIEGDPKTIISDFESWRDILKVAQTLMSEAGLAEAEAGNSVSSPA